MASIGELFQTADWHSEKHVPVIECPDSVQADQTFEVKVTLGAEIAHPNTTAHHIRWIQLYYRPEGGKFAHQLGNFEFTAHGESTDGPDTGPACTDHSVTARIRLARSGTLVATSLCNIHGLWEFSKPITVS